MSILNTAVFDMQTPHRHSPHRHSSAWQLHLLLLLGLGLGIAGASLAAPAEPAKGASPGHLRLINDLDRPQDGYCIDILGSGNYIRFDLPMTAHNCKPGLYADEAVVIDGQRIRFPAYGACATVAGLNSRALPGAAIVARECDEKSPFMEADKLQRFTFHKDGRVELAGANLCLTAGAESDSTFEKTHRWRTLFVERCEKAEPARSRWRFVVPKQ